MQADTARAGGARLARLLQLDRGRIRTLLLAACVLFGRPTPLTLEIGLLVIVPGAALHLWTKGCLRIGEEVTTSGPYRYVRNPFYLATLVIDAGLCVVAAEPWIGAGYAPVWLVVHGMTIRREERALTAMFGERYTSYLAKVPRLFPWRGAATGLPSSTGFTWSNPQLVDGVEYARLARTFMSAFLVFAGARAFTSLRAGTGWPTAPADLAAQAAVLACFLAERALVLRSRRRKAGRAAK